MLEISSFNENASIGRQSSDVESDKPSRLSTAPFSEKAANVQGHVRLHILYSIERLLHLFFFAAYSHQYPANR